MIYEKVVHLDAFAVPSGKDLPQVFARGGIMYSPDVKGLAKLGAVRMDWQPWIVRDPKVKMGKPVILGTRTPVDLILEKLAAGETVQDLEEAHPRLTEEAVRAALAYAAVVLRLTGGRLFNLFAR